MRISSFPVTTSLGSTGAQHVHHSVTELAAGLHALRPDLELLELEPGQLLLGAAELGGDRFGKVARASAPARGTGARAETGRDAQAARPSASARAARYRLRTTQPPSPRLASGFSSAARREVSGRARASAGLALLRRGACGARAARAPARATARAARSRQLVSARRRAARRAGSRRGDRADRRRRACWRTSLRARERGRSASVALAERLRARPARASAAAAGGAAATARQRARAGEVPRARQRDLLGGLERELARRCGASRSADTLGGAGSDDACCSASRSSSTSAKRAAGSFASARSTTASSASRQLRRRACAAARGGSSICARHSS